MGIVFDIVIVAILTICILIGYKRGLVKVAFNICAFVISLLITMILYTPVTNLIINNTNIDDNIEKVIIENTSEENGNINEKSGINRCFKIGGKYGYC